ncbi:hypothetical protein [Gemmatimonas aurantiaca]|uniref:hypothetical protein n=1 Tax=Gemmatimonas aurantiaca TaxID=173480 RepID=UPI00301C22F6
MREAHGERIIDHNRVSGTSVQGQNGTELARTSTCAPNRLDRPAIHSEETDLQGLLVSDSKSSIGQQDNPDDTSKYALGRSIGVTDHQTGGRWKLPVSSYWLCGDRCVLSYQRGHNEERRWNDVPHDEYRKLVGKTYGAPSDDEAPYRNQMQVEAHVL